MENYRVQQNYRDIIRQYSDVVQDYRTKVSAFERNYGPDVLERYVQEPVPDHLRDRVRRASLRIRNLAEEARNLWYRIGVVGLHEDPNVRTDPEIFDNVNRTFMRLLSEWHILWNRTLPPSQGGRRRPKTQRRRRSSRRRTQRL